MKIPPIKLFNKESESSKNEKKNISPKFRYGESYMKNYSSSMVREVNKVKVKN